MLKIIVKSCQTSYDMHPFCMHERERITESLLVVASLGNECVGRRRLNWTGPWELKTALVARAPHKGTSLLFHETDAITLVMIEVSGLWLGFGWLILYVVGRCGLVLITGWVGVGIKQPWPTHHQCSSFPSPTTEKITKLPPDIFQSNIMLLRCLYRHLECIIGIKHRDCWQRQSLSSDHYSLNTLESASLMSAYFIAVL